MNEGIVILLLISGISLWLIGGWKWTPARRYVWPVLALVLLLFSHIVWWKAFLAALTMVGVNTLPYGDRVNWLGRSVVFSLYAFPAAWLGVSTLLVSVPLTVVSLLILMWLSRKFNWVTWKIWEAEAGLLQAASLIMGTHLR